jgi:hypothetical protein
MISTQDIRVDEFFANPSMPYGIRITHMLSGIAVEGNCRTEAAKNNVHATLMNVLNQFIANETKAAGSNGDAEHENDLLREQLLMMQAQLNALLNRTSAPDVVSAPVEKPIKAARGRPRGHHEVSPEARQKLSEAMTARHAAKRVQQEEEAKLLAQQMRPPTDAPMELPRSHQSHGSVVARSNVPWIKP